MALWNTVIFFSSVQFSLSVKYDSLQPHGLQQARLPCPSSSPSLVQSLSRVWLFVTTWTAARQASLSITNSQSPPKAMSVESVMPSKHLILCRPHLLLPSIFPASRSFPNSQFFTSGGQSIAVSDLASFFSMNIQDWFPLYWLVGSPWSPRDSQESSPTPQFKSINTLVLSLLHSSTLKSIYDHWKNHSLD